MKIKLIKQAEYISVSVGALQLNLEITEIENNINDIYNFFKSIVPEGVDLDEVMDNSMIQSAINHFPFFRDIFFCSKGGYFNATIHLDPENGIITMDEYTVSKTQFDLKRLAQIIKDDDTKQQAEHSAEREERRKRSEDIDNELHGDISEEEVDDSIKPFKDKLDAIQAEGRLKRESFADRISDFPIQGAIPRQLNIIVTGRTTAQEAKDYVVLSRLPREIRRKGINDLNYMGLNHELDRNDVKVLNRTLNPEISFEWRPLEYNKTIKEIQEEE